MDHLSQAPGQTSSRVAVVDILRGYALLGVAVINYTAFRGWDYSHGSKLDSILGFVATYVFFHKSALLLSMLFGYGFAVLMDKLQKRRQNAPIFFLKRMFWLLVIAIINSVFFEGDILKSYAILGVVFLLFFRSSAKTVLLWAAILTSTIPLISGYSLYGMSSHTQALIQSKHALFLSHNPFDVASYNLFASFVGQSKWPFYALGVQHIMICCFLWGAYAHKTHFAESLAMSMSKVRRLFWFSIPAFGISLGIAIAEQRVPVLLKYFNFFLVPYLCATIFFASGIMWLYGAGRLQSIFSSMQCYGRMTLTNYIVQNIIAFFAFSGVGLSIGNSRPYWFYFVLAILVYVIQIFISRYWLKRYKYGPVEWLWRRLGSRETLMKPEWVPVPASVVELSE